MERVPRRSPPSSSSSSSASPSSSARSGSASSGESTDRCGYRLEVGLGDDEFSTEPCDRPRWGDHDRCVWHAKVDGKTSDLFEDHLPESEEDLDGAYLEDATLVGVDWFTGKSLVGAHLTNADLNGVDFSDADLTLATLTSASAINADFDRANLEGAIFTNADLRRATLEDALLNEAVFTDVHIGDETAFGDVTIYERERVEPNLGDHHPLRAAAWAYRQLQQLYRANALPKLARRSYVQEKDVRRRLAWEEGRYPLALRREVSRWVMQYGSSPYRILGVSTLVITVSALLYPFTGGIQEVQGGQTITYTLDSPEDAPRWWLAEVLFKSLYFSVVTFATLGYGDIQPLGATARMLAGAETILGSLLTALLVFVLTRIVTW